MDAGLSIGFDVDFKKLERQLDDVSKKALPKAAAGWLNGIAFEARKQLIEHNKEAFDRPVPFTNKAWVVNKAKPADGERMSSEVRAQPVQAAYLQYQIFGGERGAGDPGSGKWDVFAHADKLTRFGGVDKGFLLRTSKRHRDERKARAELRKKRIAVRNQRAAGAYGPFPDYRWVTHSRNRPGIFFGEVRGLRGYWERPRLTKAAKKRRRGVITVRPRGSNRPKLLVAMKDSVRYKPRYRYDMQIMRAIATAGTAAAFQRELSRALSRR